MNRFRKFQFFTFLGINREIEILLVRICIQVISHIERTCNKIRRDRQESSGYSMIHFASDQRICKVYFIAIFTTMFTLQAIDMPCRCRTISAYTGKNFICRCGIIHFCLGRTFSIGTNNLLRCTERNRISSITSIARIALNILYLEIPCKGHRYITRR